MAVREEALARILVVNIHSSIYVASRIQLNEATLDRVKSIPQFEHSLDFDVALEDIYSAGEIWRRFCSRWIQTCVDDWVRVMVEESPCDRVSSFRKS